MVESVHNSEMEFHEKVAYHAEKQRYKQADLVDAVSSVLIEWGLEGLSTSSMSRYWNGKRLPPLIEAAAIARVLGLTLDYLVDHSKEMPDKGLTQDELYVLKTYRALRDKNGIDEIMAVERLHSDASGVTRPPIGYSSDRKPGQKSG